jgi:hypothetical protein
MEINNKNISFNGINKGQAKVSEKGDVTNILVEKSRKHLLERAQREVPPNGPFTRLFVAFDIPNSLNEAVIAIEHDEKEPKTQRRLSIGVHHQYSDKVFSNYVLKGTKEDILNYLYDQENQESIKSTILNLSKKTDDYYSSL